MEKIGRGTMISIGSVIAAIIPASLAWSRLESKVYELENHKADKLSVIEAIHRVERRIYEIQLANGLRAEPPPAMKVEK